LRPILFSLTICVLGFQTGVARSDPGLVIPAGTPDALLANAVSGFAETQVEVVCGGDANSLFLGLTIDTTIWLNEPLVCKPVRRFAQGWRPREDHRNSGAQTLAHAILTLTHEAIHAAGNTSEAQTECFAIQRVPEMTEQLGEHRPLYIAAIEHKALQWHKRLRGTISLSGQPYSDQTRCRKDGRWDLTPDDGVWP
jgi:hypothetical protein